MRVPFDGRAFESEHSGPASKEFGNSVEGRPIGVPITKAASKFQHSMVHCLSFGSHLFKN